MDLRNKPWQLSGNAVTYNKLPLLNCFAAYDIQIEKRIGSPSANAEVFKARMHGNEVAVKVMPVRSERSKAQNEKEQEFAETLSQFEGFLPVLAVASCERTIWDVKSKFAMASIMYQDKRVVETDIIFSPLMWGDLTQLREGNWRSLLEQVFQAVWQMQRLQIVHGDLHTGNVLVNGGKTYVHDFGTTRYVPAWTMDSRLQDLDKFLLTLSMKKIPELDVLVERVSGALEDYEDADDPSVSPVPACLDALGDLGGEL